MKVYLLVWCDNPANARTSLLTFETIRVGFPTAEIICVDNASILATETQRLCEKVGARYIRLEREVSHADYVAWIILNESSAVLVDPDIVFWEKVEGWSFSGLMAGRLIPHFYDGFAGCHTVSRLHTSFLWFPDLVALREAVKRERPPFFNPFYESTQKVGGQWVRWDTLCGLYHMLIDRAVPFTDELDAYDHLFCGTHIDRVIGDIPELGRSFALRGAELKGHWREQDKYFQDNRSVFLEGLYQSEL